MQHVINQLIEIEDKHQGFFNQSGKTIFDFLTESVLEKGVYINTELPKEIREDVRKLFDATTKENIYPTR